MWSVVASSHVTGDNDTELTPACNKVVIWQHFLRGKGLFNLIVDDMKSGPSTFRIPILY